MKPKPKILITAGPTWVRIDDVRIITNIFTGKTGLYLAKEFKEKGFLVTLFFNPHTLNKKIKGIKMIPFKYFEDFRNKLIKELKKNEYDIIIHSAAVSDYKVKKISKGKIPSGKKSLILKLVPTEKVIKRIRKLSPKSTFIQFKLEIKRENLLEKAYRSLKENESDFVVANALKDLKLRYQAFFIDKNKNIIPIKSKKFLFDLLYKVTIKRKKSL
jgi:phosphopantothenoylcysteine decarboxylase/phosphopantothenate--cysteine ligase